MLPALEECIDVCARDRGVRWIYGVLSAVLSNNYRECSAKRYQKAPAQLVLIAVERESSSRVYPLDWRNGSGATDDPV